VATVESLRSTRLNPSGQFENADHSYRPDIDGLRGLAILSVVFYHAGVQWLPGGFTGVDIFFVISGYLIGGQIFAEVRRGNFSFLRFYQRRARRILPAFYAVLLFTIAAALLLLSPFEARQFGRTALAATLSASNILFWHGAKYFDTKSEFIPLLMTWTLAVEEQFYAVIPLLLVLLAHLRRKLILPAILAVCALSFLLAERELAGQSQAALQAAFYLLPARAWELGIGVALAVAEQSSNHNARRLPALIGQFAGLIGLIMMLAPVFLLSAHSPFPGAGALPSVLGTALVIAFPKTRSNRRVLSLPPLVFAGKISYSWYLWHWPLLAFLHIVCGNETPRAAPLLAVVAAFAIAVLSYYFIEQPFRRSTTAPASLLIRYALASAAMFAIGAAIWMSHGLPQRYPLLAQIEAANPPLTSDPCLIEDDQDEPNLSQSCISESGLGPSVALWGDSHAAALAPGLRAVVRAQNYGFSQFTKTSCLPLTDVLRYIPRIAAQAERCLEFNRKVLDMIRADRRIRIVILTGAWAGCFDLNWEGGWLSTDPSRRMLVPSLESVRQLFVQSMADEIQSLRAVGKSVVLLEDVPNFDFDPMWRVRTETIPMRRVIAEALGMKNGVDFGFGADDGDRTAGALANDSLRQAVSTQPGAELIDLKPALCQDEARCAYRLGDRMLYFDSGHLTAFGALYAVRNLRISTLAELNP
jgi:peptidoglycan/LPS O-acetylase OafA/YrhL